MKPPRARIVTIYTKPECGLCEEAEEVIEAVRARSVRSAFTLVRRNILEDFADYEKYKHDIPVILLDGREIARHHLDEAAFMRELEAAAVAAAPDVVVIVMTKFPAPGRVKTRLAPPLTTEQAARLHHEFLLHVIGRLRSWRVIACYDPPGSAADMRRLIDVELMAQSASDASTPADHVIFLGIDSPDVPLAYLDRVADLLGTNDVVIAPADDGGYWAVALGPGVDASELFSSIEWSTGREGAQTLERARHLGYNVALADRWADVDRPDDLRRLVERLKRSAAADDRRLLDRLSFLPDGVV
jgi:uncharacterized protein